MDFEIEQLIKDLKDWNLPRDFETACEKVKCPLEIGQRVDWYYLMDKEFYDDMGEDVKEYNNYSGIVVPRNGVASGRELEIEDVVIIVDMCPTEKDSPDISWVSLKRMIDDDDLVEMYIREIL